MTNVQALVESYGYYAVVIGTFLEGETVLIIAGFAAYRGYLSLPWVMVAAFAGSLLGDQFYFFLGRRYGARILRRFPRAAERAVRVNALFSRYHTAFILVMRFLYGFRTIGPVVLGMSDIPTIKFVALNIIGAIVWTVVISSIGYVFGGTLEFMLKDMKRYEVAIFIGIALLGAGIGLMHWLRARAKTTS